ncbi:hypothetical protein pEaSNUABM8_00213 [Erwinia phage pEa_SNUABM_8]|nr:hypothetical protein pEaSNUABM8_00213 [Erwinia phage pEa_SNUABM_8]QVW54965.1 hypothetical protein pEaSNUABM4_00212 [Erwinia phage pEa_SNUABM_4]
MNVLNTFTEARKYFEVIAAYNIDRFRFQSMISTAHKLETLNDAIRAGMPMEEISKGVTSVSDYWYYKAIHSPMLKGQREIFEHVKVWAEDNGLAFNTAADSFHTDAYCNHMLVKNPHSGGYEIFNLETGTAFAASTLPGRNTSPAGVAEINGKYVPVFNFTRRECGAKSLAVISHQTTH